MIRTIRRGYMGFVYLFLYLPIVIVVCFSFNDSHHSLLWHGFTLKWYGELFGDYDLARITEHSFVLATASSTLASFLGVTAAICFYRFRIWGRSFWSLLLFFLIVVPDLILAIAFFFLFRTIAIPFGFWTLFLAHTTFCLPFVFITIMGRLQGLNPYLLEAAVDLGASDVQSVWHVLLPALRPAIAMGWLMSFALSLDDVVISYFVSGPSYEILPLRIYSMARLGADPEINAMCSVLFLVTLVLVIISQRLMRKQ